MASLTNALRNITGDNWWLVKMLVFSYLAFFVFINSEIIFQNNTTNLIILSSIAIIYMGSLSVMMHRNLNNITPILPSFISLPEIIFKGIMSVIAVLPVSIILYLIISFIKTNIQMEPFVMALIYIIISLIFAPFIFIPMVLYSVNGKINDAFRFNIIMEASGNFIVQFLSYILQCIFTIILVSFLLYKLLTEMLGYTQAVEVLVGLTIAFVIFSLFSYCSDMYTDVIPEIKAKKKKKR